MTKINSRHILNGFDPNFSGPFLEKSQKIPTVFKLLWYCIIGFTLLLLFINMILRKKPLLASKYLLIISIFTLSGFISTIPAAIEPRFYYKYNLHVLTTLGPLNNDFLN